MEIRISLALFRAARKMHKMAPPSGRKLRNLTALQPPGTGRGHPSETAPSPEG